LLPVVDNTSDASYLIFNYRRSDDAAADPNTTIRAEYSVTLSSWTTAVNDDSTVIITPYDDFYGSGVDKVEVKIHRDLALGGKLFTRLYVER
jgi:hypothetical protein